MAEVVYTGNIAWLAEGYAQKKWESINDRIKKNKNHLTNYIEKNGEIFGYEIRENVPLTTLYGFRVRVVDFEFSNINDLSNSEEDGIVDKLFNKLRKTMMEEPAYYTMRVPTAIMSLLMMVNKYFENALMCGGTISYIATSKVEEKYKQEKTNVFVASKDYIDEHRMDLIKIAEKTFKMYRGQYHISPITAEKAMEIYSDWVTNTFDAKNELFFVAEYNNKIAGYATRKESEKICEAIIGGTSSEYRQLGAYKNIIKNMLNKTIEEGKYFVSGTQFENLIVQSTWISLGMKPFTSFYNFHIDARK